MNQPIQKSASFDHNSTSEIVDRLFGAHVLKHDLSQGVQRSGTDEREIFITEDMIRGLYKALHYEVADAWVVIMKHAGKDWGRRAMASISKSLSSSSVEINDMQASSFVSLIESYFSTHGWGLMEFDLSHAESHGIVIAKLQNSIFSKSLSEIEGNVDAMIEGMLGSIFSSISGHDLDCFQVTRGVSGTTTGADFLISSSDRIEPLVDNAASGMSVASALKALKGN